MYLWPRTMEINVIEDPRALLRKVKVVGATGSLPDPYASGERPFAKKTVKKNTLNPNWNETFNLWNVKLLSYLFNWAKCLRGEVANAVEKLQKEMVWCRRLGRQASHELRLAFRGKAKKTKRQDSELTHEETPATSTLADVEATCRKLKFKRLIFKPSF
ncbi:hypothetical protein SELMODRAFT_402909 [Selaginella moellendorffii]|uniref:C2 domain-containing protein n=1 Tax=Selaginella moellendorffii TaxID=88036 RepID=D8QNF1_SELML|nr:hypothetical protein SELMODRAFT_402909 [Selaginella moellendorffii]